MYLSYLGLKTWRKKNEKISGGLLTKSKIWFKIYKKEGNGIQNSRADGFVC